MQAVGAPKPQPFSANRSPSATQSSTADCPLTPEVKCASATAEPDSESRQISKLRGEVAHRSELVPSKVTRFTDRTAATT
jgi:hypothetical protein